MRRPIVRALVFVLTLTFLVLWFTYFIQTLLPSKVNNLLYFFFLALVSAIGVAAGFLDIVDRLSGKGKVEAGKPPVLRHRRNMLQLVYNIWIKGVLQKSLYKEILIDLGLETQPDAVDFPWDTVFQMSDHEPKKLGSGNTVVDIFDESNGFLLILGEPGSGKTTTLLELARQLILRAQKKSDEPIPVVFNLATWSPKTNLSDWLVQELQDKYYVPQRIGRPWVEQDELLLLLDGLDEVKAENREACVQAINTYREEYDTPIAICSRRWEYEQLEEKPKLWGAVLIHPLTPDQIDNYLRRAGRGLRQIRQLLSDDLTLQEFVKTPLVMSTIVMAYRNASDEIIQDFEAATDRYKHLFDAYIQQMFCRKGLRVHYKMEQTKRWLSWLANKMESEGRLQFHVEDINLLLNNSGKKTERVQIDELIGKLVTGLIFGLTVGLVFGLKAGLIIGLISASWSGLLNSTEEYGSIDKLTWSWKQDDGRPDYWLISGAIIVLLPGVIMFMVLNGMAGLITGLITGLILELPILVFGIRGAYFEERTEPGEGIRASLKNALFTGLIFGLIFGIFGGIAGLIINLINVKVDYVEYPLIGRISFPPDVGLNVPLIFWLGGWLYFGFRFSLDYGGGFFITHYTTRFILFKYGNMPWNLISFLEYCTNLGFLRRVGGGYIFIHGLLKEHFAKMYEENKQS